MRMSRIFAHTLTLLCFALASPGIVIAQQQPSNAESRKTQLEVRKLELEIQALEQRRELPGWLTAIVGLVVGAAGTAASVWVARRARQGALDQALHEKRIDSYADLVKAMAPLALYFPPHDTLGSNHCRAMGEAMREWYFAGGGLLMSTEARNAYFALARGLTRACLVEDLKVPVFAENANEISVSTMDEYRRRLRSLGLSAVEHWTFGDSHAESREPALRFKDFVFLQTLASTLRTQLCADLHSRRRPS